MSKFTTQLRFPIEQKLNELGLEHNEDNWVHCYKILGLNDYPIFDEEYRTELNNKIIRAYYFNEIGAETLAQFAWFVRDTMFQIMPTYNELYVVQMELLRDDPLNEINIRYDRTWDSHNESSSDSDSTFGDRNIFSDTPMSMLESEPTKIHELKYATTVTYDDNEGTNHSDGTSNGNGHDAHTEIGHRKSPSKLFVEFQEAFVNIDMEIIKDLSTCFMGLW